MKLMHVLNREKVEWINTSDQSGDSNDLLKCERVRWGVRIRR